jgi:hypothetical protein
MNGSWRGRAARGPQEAQVAELCRRAAAQRERPQVTPPVARLGQVEHFPLLSDGTRVASVSGIAGMPKPLYLTRTELTVSGIAVCGAATLASRGACMVMLGRA